MTAALVLILYNKIHVVRSDTSGHTMYVYTDIYNHTRMVIVWIFLFINNYFSMLTTMHNHNVTLND